MNRSVYIVGLLICLAISAKSQINERQKHWNVNSDGLALDGYDPVAYFQNKKAIKGKAGISADVGGIKFRFSTTANKTSFLSSPSSYEPQYGGWCAYAMGQKGEKVEVDPETFKIVDGKLYLFYNRFFNNTLEDWNENESTLKLQADKNWDNTIKP